MQVKTVYIDGLPDSWDEEKVKEYVQQYGQIEKIQLSKNFTVARRKDFGFVSFSSRESAVACVDGINNSEIGEGDKKVNIGFLAILLCSFLLMGGGYEVSLTNFSTIGESKSS